MGKHAKIRFDKNETILSERTKQKENHRLPCTAYKFIQRSYDGIQKRCTSKPNYIGFEYLSRQEFYDWAYESKEFHELWKGYKESDYFTPLCPSPDRIDDDKGYSLDNMQWITWKENEAKGLEKRQRKLEEYFKSDRFKKNLNEGRKKGIEASRRLTKEMSKCPHCGKEGNNFLNMKRWHYDNCKSKIN